MNATEARAARRKAGSSTLEERLRRDPAMSRRIDKHLAHLRLEISRDLRGGLSRAKIGRVEELAEAVGYDFVLLVLPRDRKQRREALERLTRELAS